jgi:hypothetical protein
VWTGVVGQGRKAGTRVLVSIALGTVQREHLSQGVHLIPWLGEMVGESQAKSSCHLGCHAWAEVD